MHLHSVSMRKILNIKTQNESKWMRKRQHANSNLKEAGDTILIILEKIDFKVKFISRHRDI